MKLLALQTRFRIQDLFRQPAYVFTSLILPVIIFSFFGIPNSKTPEAAQMLMGSFSCFALISVVLYQLSVQISFEKSSPWNMYIHTLPIRSSQIFLARVIAQIIFALLSVAIVIALAHMTVDVNLPKERWLRFILSLFFGGLPFACLGVFLGILFNSTTIISAANLIYLPLTFAGGLWMPPNALSQLVQDISEYLPTRMYGELVWSSLLGTELKSQYLFGLFAYFFLFLFAAIILYRHDEGKRFG